MLAVGTTILKPQIRRRKKRDKNWKLKNIEVQCRFIRLFETLLLTIIHGNEQLPIDIEMLVMMMMMLFPPKNHENDIAFPIAAFYYQRVRSQTSNRQGQGVHLDSAFSQPYSFAVFHLAFQDTWGRACHLHVMD
jgi:hypothetical protein